MRYPSQLPSFPAYGGVGGAYLEVISMDDGGQLGSPKAAVCRDPSCRIFYASLASPQRTRNK
jgi:hypothetical protein